MEEKNHLNICSNTLSSRKIIFDDKYLINFRRNIEIIINYLPYDLKTKNKVNENALELFNTTLENGMTHSDLESKNAGVLSIVFIFFSLLFYDFTSINNKALSYGTICKLLKKNLKLIGLSSCKSRSIGEISNFLPENLKKKYQDYYSKKLFTGRLSYDQFFNYIKSLGFKKTGINGKALSPNQVFNKLVNNDYNELTSEEYYNLIKSKNATDVKVPVWCGKDKHKPWYAILSNLLQGKWCRQCIDEDKIVFSHKELIKKAKIRGLEETGVEGKILDSKASRKELAIETYERLIKNSSPGKTHFWWICGIVGHPPWSTTPKHIVYDKSWCPVCKSGLYILKELIILAKSRGLEETGTEGKILDSKVSRKELKIETYEKLTKNKKPSNISFWWSCEKRHPPFKNNPANIKRGQWCPICSAEKRKYENIIRHYFETIFNIPFNEIYLRDLNLKFCQMKIDLNLEKKNNIILLKGYRICNLKSNTPKIYKGKMRFDGYAEITINNKKIKIAFEYNGIQHYKFPNYWFENTIEGYNSWVRYISTDQKKREICKLNNIILIIIPYSIDASLEHSDKIRSFIIKKFESKSGLKLNIN